MRHYIIPPSKRDQARKKACLEQLASDRQKLLFRWPFMGSLLMQLELVPVRDDRLNTASTDGEKIYIDIDFYERLNQGERLFVLAHEVCHTALMHFVRCQAREVERFNYAADLEIHFLLQNEHFLEPWSLPCMPQWDGLSAEEIYELLADYLCDMGGKKTSDIEEGPERGKTQSASGDSTPGGSAQTPDKSQGNSSTASEKGTTSDAGQPGGEESQGDTSGGTPGGSTQALDKSQGNSSTASEKGTTSDAGQPGGEESQGDTNGVMPDGSTQANRRSDGKSQDTSVAVSGKGNSPDATGQPDNEESQGVAGTSTPNSSKQHKAPSGEQDQGNSTTVEKDGDLTEGLPGGKRNDKFCTSARSFDKHHYSREKAQSIDSAGEDGKADDMHDSASQSDKAGAPAEQQDHEQDVHPQESDDQASRMSCGDGDPSQSSRKTGGAGGGKNSGFVVDEDYTPQFSQDVAEKTLSRLIASAMQYERTQGLLPSHWQKLISHLQGPSLSWQELLKQFVTTCYGGKRRWLPPSRRHVWQDLYLPSLREERLRAVVGLDTSGSTQNDMKVFLGELVSLMKTFGKFELTVIQCDAELQRVETFTESKIPPANYSWEVMGLGGTDFRPVFDYVAQKMRMAPDLLLYFTDGMGTPPVRCPNYPVMWVLTHDGEKPCQWGHALHLSKEENHD